jgi:hypothetical protein
LVHRVAALVALMLSLCGGELQCQDIVVQSPRGVAAVEVLEDVLARRNYLLVDRDTILPADFQTAGDLIVWDAQVRLEGTVEGAAIAVQGSLFVRPGARIGGPVVAIGGLVLPSRLAEMGEVLELPPDHGVAVFRDPAQLRIVVAPPPPVPRFGLGGLFGVRRLAFDRVDGLSVAWGPQWRIGGEESGPRVDAWVTVRSARRRLGGGVQFRSPLGGALDVTARAERATVTNEWWIRSDLANSVEAFFLGRDVRDYFESDQFSLQLGRAPALPGNAGTVTFSPYVAARYSSDRTLPTRSPWAVRGRSQLERPNLPVLETAIVSGEVGTLVEWRGDASRFQARALIEVGDPREGAERFTRWLGNGRWEMEALWNHSLSVSAHAMGILGDAVAPPQRWSFVGGAGTLPRLPVAALRGDNLVFVASRYDIPLAFVELPLVGSPSVELLHAAGTAWLTGDSPPSWEQNLGVGVSLTVVRLRAWVDPTIDRPRPTLLLEFAIP